MLSRALQALLLASTLIALSGALANDVRTSDLWIEATLLTTYTLNEQLSPLEIDATVSDGVVRLEGEVPSEVERDLAEELAHGVDGVREVDNQLTLEPGTAEADEESPFMRGVQDATLTARVRSRLLWNQKTRGEGIAVDADRGEVTLAGDVSSEEARELAVEIARTTQDVTAVHDELSVRPATETAEQDDDTADELRDRTEELGEAVSDAWITSRVKTTLLFTTGIPGGAINVGTEDGVVTLSGRVDEAEQAEEAARIASETTGVKEVRNELRIGRE